MKGSEYAPGAVSAGVDGGTLCGAGGIGDGVAVDMGGAGRDLVENRGRVIRDIPDDPVAIQGAETDGIGTVKTGAPGPWSSG